MVATPWKKKSLFVALVVRMSKAPSYQIGSDSNEEGAKSSSESEESCKNKGEDAYPCNRDLLMIRRILNNEPSPQELTQRENIFHIRCKVLENTFLSLWIVHRVAIIVALG